MTYRGFIREERKRQKLTVPELAKRSDVPATTIWNWERGYTPTVDNFVRVLHGLGKRLEIVDLEG